MLFWALQFTNNLLEYETLSGSNFEGNICAFSTEARYGIGYPCVKHTIKCVKGRSLAAIESHLPTTDSRWKSVGPINHTDQLADSTDSLSNRTDT